jgi:hypothetical protein
MHDGANTMGFHDAPDEKCDTCRRGDDSLQGKQMAAAK